MGFSVMLWGAEKLVPVEYWCPYGSSYMYVTDAQVIWNYYKITV